LLKKEQIKKLKELSTPFLGVNIKKLVQTYNNLHVNFPSASIHYAVKANYHFDILSTLYKCGSNFDIASYGEFKLLNKLSIPSNRMICSAPVKIPLEIDKLYKSGINYFAFDSRMELEKIKHFAPRSIVYCRILVNDKGSQWPLSKFGASFNESIALMVYAKELGLKPEGITFHVGSQNTNINSWKKAIKLVHRMNVYLRKREIKLKFLNIGGGIPAKYNQPIPKLNELAKEINQTFKKYFNKRTVKLIIEPGRGLVAECGTIVTSVINKHMRRDGSWVFVDTGVFNGLIEPGLENGTQYQIIVPNKEGRLVKSVLCGLSCDGVDIIAKSIKLPNDILIGDKIFILNSGAYTTSIEKYNGFSFPRTIIY
jgi:ornithine decarboxylase